MCNVPRRLWRKDEPTKDEPTTDEPTTDEPTTTPGNENDNTDRQWYIPHLAILPGLQFSLAGILGKPETFYQVPVIRFIFEIFSYL